MEDKTHKTITRILEEKKIKKMKSIIFQEVFDFLLTAWTNFFCSMAVYEDYNNRSDSAYIVLIVMWLMWVVSMEYMRYIKTTEDERKKLIDDFLPDKTTT